MTPSDLYEPLSRRHPTPNQKQLESETQLLTRQRWIRDMQDQTETLRKGTVTAAQGWPFSLNPASGLKGETFPGCSTGGRGS